MMGANRIFEGLKALGVDENIYSSVVVPAVLNKLPEAFRLTITRETDFLNWNMEEMLEAFSKELELKENHDHVVSASAGRLKTQVARLGREPEVLVEYAAIIKD